jgi:hypothetical protein
MRLVLRGIGCEDKMAVPVGNGFPVAQRMATQFLDLAMPHNWLHADTLNLKRKAVQYLKISHNHLLPKLLTKSHFDLFQKAIRS